MDEILKIGKSAWFSKGWHRLVAPRSPLIARVARQVAYHRRARGLTQDELAARLQLATRNLQRIEGAQQNVTLETLERVAAALQIDAGDLLLAEEGSLKGRQGVPLMVPSGAVGWEKVPILELNDAALFIQQAKQLQIRDFAMLSYPPPPSAFICQVDDHRMSPLIPPKAFCLFSAPPERVEPGMIVLWRLRQPGPEPTFSLQVRLVEAIDFDPLGFARVTLHTVVRDGANQVIDVNEPGKLQAVATFVSPLHVAGRLSSLGPGNWGHDLMRS